MEYRIHTLIDTETNKPILRTTIKYIHIIYKYKIHAHYIQIHTQYIHDPLMEYHPHIMRKRLQSKNECDKEKQRDFSKYKIL